MPADEREMRCKNKKGYLKIHVAVNVKSKKILSMGVADEHVHDSKPLTGLVDGAIKSNSMKSEIGKLIVDSSYDSNDIFRYMRHGHNSRSLIFILLPCYQVPSIYFIDFRLDLFFIQL